MSEIDETIKQVGVTWKTLGYGGAVFVLLFIVIIGNGWQNKVMSDTLICQIEKLQEKNDKQSEAFRSDIQEMQKISKESQEKAVNVQIELAKTLQSLKESIDRQTRMFESYYFRRGEVPYVKGND
jgi:predicted transcriptional regulator